MDRELNFYGLIIGSEILNGRREDSHFRFLRDELNKRGLKFSGSFIIEDNPNLIASTIGFISTLPNSILFSFGGIGSTPDDYTREAAAKALRDGELYMNEEFKELIIQRAKEKAYPHRINMAKLPKDAKLIPNPVNNMPGFYLDDRFFFMPGFPQMSHPMVRYILDKFFSDKGEKIYRYSLSALTSEAELIDLMKSAPKGVEVSSLPKLYSDGPRVTISVASKNQKLAREEFQKYIDFLEKNNIPYGIGEE
ncbi:MAG: competence/damage-inducible protein A [Epsilonproteobacteria bacterium]|nr:competence/damage-inducible protein A [Campylobacterota bacterium]